MITCKCPQCGAQGNEVNPGEFWYRCGSSDTDNGVIISWSCQKKQIELLKVEIAQLHAQACVDIHEIEELKSTINIYTGGNYACSNSLLPKDMCAECGGHNGKHFLDCTCWPFNNK